MGLLLLPFLVSPADAGPSNCRIEEPRFEISGAGLIAVIELECVEQATADHVRYPVGTLHVGMSLWGPPSDPNRMSASSFEGGHGVPPDTLAPEDGRKTATLKLGSVPDDLTHYVVAIWAQTSPCAYIEAETCFGPFDDSLFPIPVDTYPRPNCDVAMLDRIGFFEWSESGGDPSGFVAPDEIAAVFDEVDCYRGHQTKYGLGVSLKSWPVAPLPEAAN